MFNRKEQKQDLAFILIRKEFKNVKLCCTTTVYPVGFVCACNLLSFVKSSQLSWDLLDVLHQLMCSFLSLVLAVKEM